MALLRQVVDFITYVKTFIETVLPSILLETLMQKDLDRKHKRFENLKMQLYI